MGIGAGSVAAMKLSGAEELAALHRLRVAGLFVAPDNLATLVEHRYVVVSNVGVLLTDAGHERHEELLVLERATIDMQRLREDFEVFARLDPAVKAHLVALQVLAPEDRAGHDGQVRELRELTVPMIAALQRSAQQLPRFGSYAPRLHSALDRAAAGARQHLSDPRVDSFHTVWTEAHEDYVVTLGELCPEEEQCR